MNDCVPHRIYEAIRRARWGLAGRRATSSGLGLPYRSLALLVAASFTGAAFADVTVRSAALGLETATPSGWEIGLEAGEADVTLAFRDPGGGGGVVLWSGPLVDGDREAFDADGLEGLLFFIFHAFAPDVGSARVTGTFSIALQQGEAPGLGFEASATSGRLVVSVIGEIAYVWAASATPGSEATVNSAFDAMLGAATMRGAPGYDADTRPRVSVFLGHERLQFGLPPGWTFDRERNPFDARIGSLEHPLGAVITITKADLPPQQAAAYHALSHADRVERLAGEASSSHPGAQVTIRPPPEGSRRNTVAVDVETPDLVGAVVELLADGDSEGSTAIVKIRADAPRAAAPVLAEALEFVLETFMVLPGWWRLPLPPPGG